MSPAVDRARIPSGVWALGIVSLLIDTSSEIINALLPAYLVTHLMASTVTIGLLEGFGNAVAMVSRLGAGIWSDRVRSRKALTVLGYGLAAVSKPLVPLASGLTGIVAAKFLDRLGKGIRSAPRDALVADMTPPAIRGAAFGARKALDTVGGFIGPLTAMGLMLATANDLRMVLWMASVPAVLAVGVLVVGVKEPPRHDAASKAAWTWVDALRLTAATRAAIGLACLLALARFSEAFLLLRAMSVGVGAAHVPLVLVLLHVCYGAAAYPAGRFSDRVGRQPFIVAGLAVLIVAHGLLATAGGAGALWVGIGLWGVHMGLTEGAMTAWIADACPASQRGSAFGLLSVATGVAMLTGNVVAGVLWDRVGPAAVFGAAGAVAAVVLAIVLIRGRWVAPPQAN